MIATTLHLNFLPFPTPGGTTETELRNTFGPEITRTEFTPVSAESTEIVLTFPRSVTVTRQLRFS